MNSAIFLTALLLAPQGLPKNGANQIEPTLQ